MKTIKNISLILLLTICLFADNKRPLSMQPFDVESAGNLYNRGSYLIVLPNESLESYLTNENYIYLFFYIPYYGFPLFRKIIPWYGYESNDGWNRCVL